MIQWFKLTMTALLVAAFASAVAAPKPPRKDVAGSADHPRLGRVPGSIIGKYVHKRAGSITFPVSERKGLVGKTERMSGEIWKIDYWLPKDVGAEGAAMIYRRNLEEKGFQVLFEYEDDKGFFGVSKSEAKLHEEFPPLSRPIYVLVAKGALRGKEAVVALYSFIHHTTWGDRYWAYLRVVESRPLDARLDVVGAEKMASEIGAKGHVALYGITFDLDSDHLKPESNATLSEIAKYLKAHPRVRLYVVGHTDNTGEYDYNLALSKRRAAAVTRALVGRHGIPARRLKPVGVGPVAPVASNATEEGRAKNRRVELVEQ